jgi:hypothetical protein
MFWDDDEWDFARPLLALRIIENEEERESANG